MEKNKNYKEIIGNKYAHYINDILAEENAKSTPYVRRRVLHIPIYYQINERIHRKRILSFSRFTAEKESALLDRQAGYMYQGDNAPHLGQNNTVFLP